MPPGAERVYKHVAVFNSKLSSESSGRAVYYSSVVTSTFFRLNVVIPLPLCAGRPNSFFSRNVTLSLVGLMTAAVACTDAGAPSSAGSNPMFVRPNVLVPFGRLRPTLDVLAVVAASELTGLCPPAGFSYLFSYI